MHELRSPDTDNLALTILRASSTYVGRDEAVKTLVHELGRLPFMNAATIVSVDQECRVTALDPATMSSELEELLINRPFDELKDLFDFDPPERSDTPRLRYHSLTFTGTKSGASNRRLTVVTYFVLEENGREIYLVLTSRSPHAFVKPYVERVRFIFEISKKVLITHTPILGSEGHAPSAELEEAEFSFRRLFGDLEVPILLLDDSLRILLANKAFLKLNESRPEDLTDTTIHDLLHPLDESRQWLANTAADARPYDKGLLQRAMLFSPQKSAPKVVVANLTKIDSIVGSTQLWVAVLQNFNEEFEGLRQSTYYTDTLRSALGEAPIQMFLATPSGLVLEMEGSLQSFKDILASSTHSTDNLRTTLRSLGMDKGVWAKVLEGTPQSFAVEHNSLRFRAWLSLVQGHESSKSFHVAGVVADVTSTKITEEILIIRERAGHEVRVLSESALEELEEAQWQSLVDTSMAHIHDLVQSARQRLSAQSQLLVELESTLELFVSQIAQVVEVRRRALESRAEIEALTYVHPIFGTFNRRCLLESVERDGFDALGDELDFTLVELPNIEQLRDALGVQLKDQLLLSALTRVRSILGEAFRIYSLTPNELMIVTKTKRGNDAKIAKALRLIEVPSRISGISASIKCNCATLHVRGFAPTEFSKLYNQLLELLYSERPSSRVGDIAVRQSSVKWINAMQSLSERVTSKNLVHRVEVAFDVTTEKVRLLEVMTPIRELANLSSHDPSPIPPLLCSGMYRCIEAAEVQALLELGERLHSREGIGLCINIAPSSLLDGTASSALLMDCATRVNPVRFVLDVSERHLMSYATDDISRAVHLCKRLGVQVALDEVGRGFSSFQLLQQVRFSYIKISKELYKAQIGQSHGRELASHLANLSKSIGVTPIATGVSTSEDSLELKRIGVVVQQGPYITKLLFGSDTIEARELPILLKDRFANHLNLDQVGATTHSKGNAGNN